VLFGDQSGAILWVVLRLAGKANDLRSKCCLPRNQKACLLTLLSRYEKQKFELHYKKNTNERIASEKKNKKAKGTEKENSQQATDLKQVVACGWGVYLKARFVLMQGEGYGINPYVYRTNETSSVEQSGEVIYAASHCLYSLFFVLFPALFGNKVCELL